MGRRSISGGVMPAGSDRIQFDLRVNRRRLRPTLPWAPTEANLARAREHMKELRLKIAAGTFRLAEEFPDYVRRHVKEMPLALLFCEEVFDAFLAHEEARVARGDLAHSTLESHRQILNHTWRPALGARPFLSVRYSQLQQIADAQAWSKKTYNNAISALRRAFAFGYMDHPEARDPAAMMRGARIGKKDRPHLDPFSAQDAETLIAALRRDWGAAQANYDALRFFTGLRPSEQIALLVSDYDRANGVLSITKARVHGIQRDVTKTGEDRRVELCPRAMAILESHLAWRASFVSQGRIDHDALFFTQDFKPIPNAKYPFERWRKTLKRLPLRYRKPYTARHTSVSWNLMLGRNPLWVAKQHGHRIATMLSVYAAWVEGARECDIAAIRRAFGYDCEAPTNHTPTSIPSTLPATTPVPHAIAAHFLTGAGTGFEELTIRIHMDLSGLESSDLKREMPPSGEPPPATEPKRQGRTGQKLASKTKPKSGKSLQGFRKIGGADGTRTRDPRRDRPVF
jgi:integrase